jgi:OOP family OmpA-OmpF porin
MARVGFKIALAGLLLGLPACAARVAPVAPKTYLVFFHYDAADLTPEARQIVDQAAADIKTRKPSTVTIAGFTDKEGTQDYNKRLSERRIVAVEQALTGDGIDPKTFLRIPLGESEAMVGGTGDRRIEIRLPAGPGSP